MINLFHKYYVDTLIWRDYYENRKDHFRPLGEWAFRFFKLAMEEDHIILYSSLVLDELKKDYSDEDIKDMFRVIDNIHLLKQVKVKGSQFKEAASLSKERDVPFGDALHAIIARDAAAIVITRDHHFEKLSDIVLSRKPEDLI